MNDTAIGPRLRRIRRVQDVTQAQLAERAGLATSTVQRIEKGVESPRITTVFRLAQALGVDAKALAFGDEKEGHLR